MNQLRGMLACALLVIALASIQLSLNTASNGGTSEFPSIRLLSDGGPGPTPSPAKKPKPTVKGGPGSAEFPRPLKMAGVEIYWRDCPSGRGARMKVKLLEHTEINGHCEAAVKKAAKAKKKGPKAPKGAGSSREKPPSPPRLPPF